MSIVPRYVSVGSLFMSSIVFEVPKYQRDYAWDSEALGDFCDDIKSCCLARAQGRTREHFFGGLLGILRRIEGSARNQCELVDGQQRLATFVLLVSHLVQAYLSLAEGRRGRNEEPRRRLLASRADRLKKQYLEYDDEINRAPQTVPKIRLSKTDMDFYQQLIDGNRPSPQRASHKRLLVAAQRIDALIDSLLSPRRIDSKINALHRLEEVLNDDCTVIHITTDRAGEAYRLFQVLNDRGLNLTEGDLLRARTLELLDSPSGRVYQDEVEQMWDDILADPPTRTRDHLRWYYASVVGKPPGRTTLFDEWMSQVFSIHGSQGLTPREARMVRDRIKEFLQAVLTMRKMEDGDWPYNPRQPVTQWDRNRLQLLVCELNHTHCMPLLLAATALDHKSFSDLVHSVERFVFRYKLICGQHIGKAAAIYLKNAQEVRRNPKTYRVSALKRELKKLLEERAPDAAFSTLLGDLEYSPRRGNKHLKYLLITLEDYWRWITDGASGNPKVRDKSRVFDFGNTTIEHVYPQNAPASRKRGALEAIKHTLGNLTILGPGDNEIADTKPFNEKRKLLKKTQMSLNRGIAAKRKWTQVVVQNRQDVLVKAAVKIFRV